MKIECYEAVGGDIIVNISISKLDAMVNDRADKLMNYILREAGDALAKKLIETHFDEVYKRITPDEILAIVCDKIKDKIAILPDK